MTIVYDRGFNLNEWFVIILSITGLILAWRFRNRFSAKELIVYFMYGFFIGTVFDHIIGIAPFDFYDINDSSLYELTDFLTYLMYGPYGYFYVYFYDLFKIKSSHAPIYILLWALISMMIEFIGYNLGVFHYKNGYEIYYSFPIYLLVLVPNLCLYKLFHLNKIGS